MMNEFGLDEDIDLQYYLNGNYDPYVQPSDYDSVDFSEFHHDVDLNFLSKILMEEDMEEKIYMIQGDPELVAAVESVEKPFYDIIANSHGPVSPDGPPIYMESSTSPDDSGSAGLSSDLSGGSEGNYYVGDGWNPGTVELMFPPMQDANGLGFVNGMVPDLFSESQSVWQFNKGVEEASKFLPDSSKLIIDVFPRDVMNGYVVKPVESVVDEARGVKNYHRYNDDDDVEEGRSAKQPAVESGDHVPKELYDEVLLCRGENECVVITDANGGVDNAKENASKVSNGGKSKVRRQGRKEVVDLRSLLVLCAQSVAADDRLSANAQLKQIRHHSSITGDGSQRMAHYFANGLEARLSGIGSQVYRSHMAKRTIPAANILKAYQVYTKACPFKKYSHVFTNQMILRATRKATRIHIVNFGIGFGYQWPCLIESLSSLPSGPPKLRITGIDFPQSGFRPAERLQETGRRLADYAKEFNVPFEYNSIAAKWDEIEVEDLDIREDEVLVVTCLYMLQNLADETVTVESPRNIVLNTIRKMNPAFFIHSVVNGAYSSPFFVTRFREALFHFSAIFDAFDFNMSRENQQRMCLEREFLGQEVLNVIACEGAERVQRPETYKQWQLRTQRCGFSQLPLDPEILKICKEKVMSRYSKDYLVDTDGKWVLQGWKGRVLYAISSWRPSRSGF